MTTLAYDKPRSFDIVKALGSTLERASPVVADDIIYAGAAVGRSSAGVAGPLTDGGGTFPFFLGFAYRRADNAGGAASAIRVDLHKEGLVKLDVVGVSAITSNGALVYATDDDTFTLTAGTVSRAVIGRVHSYVGADAFRAEHAATTCWVHFIAHDYSTGTLTGPAS